MLGLGKRTFTVLLMTAAVLAVSAAVVYAGNHGGDHPKAAAKHHGGKHHRHHGNGKAGFPPSVARFDLSGYVLQTKYTLGRNTGNTFQQTYTGDSVQGVPTAGPFVGRSSTPRSTWRCPSHTRRCTWCGRTPPSTSSTRSS